jgi:hypothetical protein
MVTNAHRVEAEVGADEHASAHPSGSAGGRRLQLSVYLSRDGGTHTREKDVSLSEPCLVARARPNRFAYVS